LIISPFETSFKASFVACSPIYFIASVIEFWIVELKTSFPIPLNYYLRISSAEVTPIYTAACVRDFNPY
jgi:hypothetical protein